LTLWLVLDHQDGVLFLRRMTFAAGELLVSVVRENVNVLETAGRHSSVGARQVLVARKTIATVGAPHVGIVAVDALPKHVGVEPVEDRFGPRPGVTARSLARVLCFTGYDRVVRVVAGATFKSMRVGVEVAGGRIPQQFLTGLAITRSVGRIEVLLGEFRLVLCEGSKWERYQ